MCLVSSPEALGSQGELIVYPSSVARRRRCCSHFSNNSSATPESIKAKLRVQHPKGVGTKVCTNCYGHMTKVTARARNSKNFKFSSPEQEGL